FIDGTLHGISQVFLFPGILASLFFIAGLAVESVVCACYAVVGSLIATLLAYYLGANAHDISSGLYAFSAVLTSVALGTVFNQPGWRVFIYTISGIIFTVFIQAAMNVLLMPFGIPTLTMPFVISSWLFLVPNKEFMPEHRHS
ncbi:TPA: urea transporter, partial [Citrobacter freundii]